MTKFTAALSHWGCDSFAQTLKSEVERLTMGSLPLEKATTQGGHVDDSNISITVIDVAEQDHLIRAKVGVFFSEIVGGCSCGDEPVVENVYCEMVVSIDKETAEAELSLISE